MPKSFEECMDEIREAYLRDMQDANLAPARAFHIPHRAEAYPPTGRRDWILLSMILPANGYRKGDIVNFRVLPEDIENIIRDYQNAKGR